jgi:hypothetical protein
MYRIVVPKITLLKDAKLKGSTAVYAARGNCPPPDFLNTVEPVSIGLRCG